MQSLRSHVASTVAERDQMGNQLTTMTSNYRNMKVDCDTLTQENQV